MIHEEDTVNHDDGRFWSGLDALREPFPPEVIGKLPRSGIKLDYVGHAAVTDRLLNVDPMWTWEPMALDDFGLPQTGPDGELWIRLTVCGVTRLGVSDGGETMKVAIGDALRNAAMRFGVALDLWSRDELESRVVSGTSNAATARHAENLATFSQITHQFPPDGWQRLVLKNAKTQFHWPDRLGDYSRDQIRTALALAIDIRDAEEPFDVITESPQSGEAPADTETPTGTVEGSAGMDQPPVVEDHSSSTTGAVFSRDEIASVTHEQITALTQSLKLESVDGSKTLRLEQLQRQLGQPPADVLALIRDMTP